MHPVQVNLFVVFRNNRDFAVLDGFGCALRERRNFDEPLRRQPWLDYRAAAIALSNRDGVILLADQEALFAQVFQHALASFIAIQSGIPTRIFVHAGLVVDHLNLRQIVA